MLNKIAKKLAMIGIILGGTVHGETLTGAGATFPYPIYSKWAGAYEKEKGVQLNYQSIGSGGGIKQIKAKTVDFGASDKPLNLDNPQGEDKADKDTLYQFPVIIGGIVLIYNLPELKDKQLILNGKVLSDIYTGKIKMWDDATLQALNPQVSLPHKEIILVHRSDGSGTTFQFTTYLAKVNKEDWKNRVNALVDWPSGVGASFIILQKKGANNKAVLNFFNWAFEKGGAMAEKLQYVALPEKIVNQVKALWKKEQPDWQAQ